MLGVIRPVLPWVPAYQRTCHYYTHHLKISALLLKALGIFGKGIDGTELLKVSMDKITASSDDHPS